MTDLTSIKSNPPITARKLIPFMKKHQPAPTNANTMPAIVGPRMRAVLNIAELSAIAFIKSSRPTISITND